MTFVVHAQASSKVPRIGLLGGSTPTSPEAGHIWEAFFQGLRDLGYVQGRNVFFEGRYYGNNLEQLPAFAAELVRIPVDVIVAGATPAPEAARRATSTIPIVMPNHTDPVGTGLVASFSRPGGNVTGLSLVSTEMRVKQLQLLKEILPNLTRVAFLRHPDISFDLNALEGTARALNVRMQVVNARAASEFADAFSAATRERAGALVVLAGSLFFAHRDLLAQLAAKHRLPTVYLLKEHAEAGGLLAYGVDLRDSFRRAASYVDKILKGASPGELPIERPTKFELVVNMKTAKAFALKIPPSVLARATQVIE